MIKFSNVSKFYYPDNYALRDINFRIKSGEFVSIVGQSGAGKSTIVRLIIAEEQATEGKLVIGGWDITNIRRRGIPILRRQIGVVFQDFKLLSKRTVFENIAFALETTGVTTQKIEQIVGQVLKIVNLEEKINRFPNELSIGEIQRVSIARALVHRPKVLIADEPTGNLDPINAQDIINLLKKINEFGTTVLLVTHNRESVNYLKERVITLEKGRIISDRQQGRYIL